MVHVMEQQYRVIITMRPMFPIDNNMQARSESISVDRGEGGWAKQKPNYNHTV